MLQRQIVVKVSDKQIDGEDPGHINYISTTFDFIISTFIYVDVTIYRTVPLRRYQGNHFTITTKLRSCI